MDVLNQKRQEYLWKALRADEQADKTVDPQTADTWRRIAESYRELAHLGEHRPPHWPE